ncbi:MAG: hypothetical protein AAF493_02350 [Pseudomonadota bacterium]
MRKRSIGGVREHGRYLLAFSTESSGFDALLSHMSGTATDGIVDRLTHYSKPDTGAYWFASSEEAL